MTRSTPTSLSFKGQVTKHILLKNSIIEFSNGQIILYSFFFSFVCRLQEARRLKVMVLREIASGSHTLYIGTYLLFTQQNIEYWGFFLMTNA